VKEVLAKEVGEVPCPNCGEYPDEMIQRSMIQSRKGTLDFSYVCLGLSAISAFIIPLRHILDHFFGINVKGMGLLELPSKVCWAVSIGAGTLGLGAICTLRWWARMGDKNKQPLQERLDRARRLAVDIRTIHDNKRTSELLSTAEAELENEIVEDRRKLAADGYKVSPLLVVLGIGSLVAAIFGCFDDGLTFQTGLFFLGGVTFICWGLSVGFTYWQLRNVCLQQLSESVERVQVEEHELTVRPWSRAVLSRRHNT